MREVGVFSEQWRLVGPRYFSHCSSKCGYLCPSPFHTPPKIRSGDQRDYPSLKFSSVASASSAPSVSGSGAEYSVQVLDAGMKKSKKTIAGIDQDELVEPRHLADPDSCFCEFKGVHIHHKIYDVESPSQGLSQNQNLSEVSHQTQKLGLPMILLHGLGASVFSWEQVMKHLAEAAGSKVLAFDRPAFGLTSRVTGYISSVTDDSKPLNPYSMAFSVLATLYFINQLTADKAILVGHSAGSLVAIDTYFEAPERVAALILITPVIFGPITTPETVKENQTRKDNQMEEGSSSTIRKNPFLGLYEIVSKITKYIAKAIIQRMKGMMTDMLNSLYRIFLSAILRSALGVMLVRMVIDEFSIAAVLRYAWFDPKQVSEHVLHGYTKPFRTKDWDRALVEFIVTTLLDDISKSKQPISQRLHEISCPVLIITGDSDKVVPSDQVVSSDQVVLSWTAERISRIIPGSSLEVIKQCGHLPHEEKVDEFISVVDNFMQRLVGDLRERDLQALT